MKRPLPTAEEAAQILASRRTRPARRAAPPAGKALAKTLQALEARFGPGSQGLAGRWREIVGEALARHTEPVKLTKPRGGGPGVLEIRVDGPAAALVQHQAREILARVALVLGEGQVEKLRISQGPVRTSARLSETALKAAARRRRAAPLDAAQEAELAASLADAPDGRLKQALLKLGRAVLRGR